MADSEHTARLVVHGLDSMDDDEHFRLIKWLRQQASFLEKTPLEKFSPRFTARLQRKKGFSRQ